MSRFVETSFVNEVDQTIYPGDEVLYIGTSWKSTRAKVGKFAGVYIGEILTWNREKVGYDKNEGIVAVKVLEVERHRVTYNSESGKYDYGTKNDGYAVLPLKRVYKLHK